MVVDVYTAILQELGKNLGVELHSDQNNSCLLKLKEGVKLQIELDRTGEALILGSDLGEVPAGSYRENLFREALRANGMANPRYGTLAYSQQKDHLVLFASLPLKDLTGDKVFAFLSPFAIKAKVWKDAIERGEVPVIQASGSGGIPSGLFGLTKR